MDGTVNAAATGEARVGGVDDCIDTQRRDVGALQPQHTVLQPHLHRASYAVGGAAIARQALCPPKPKDVEMTSFGCASRPTLGM
jgi:hypothetical protein